MKNLKRIAVVILMVGIITSCGGNDNIPGGSGLIEATEVVISSEIGGRLLKLNFNEGDPIQWGDTIALIDTITPVLLLKRAGTARITAEIKIQTSRLQVEEAALDHDLAGKEFERVKSLTESGSMNRQQYDNIENRYLQTDLARKTARVALSATEAALDGIMAEIDLIKKQLSDCYPLSSTAGRVVSVYVERGELVGVGKSLIKIARLDTVWVKIYLPPTDLTGIKLGGKAEIDPEDGGDRYLIGTITWISSEAEFTPKNVQTREARADLVYAVKITIPNNEGHLKTGMPVSVKIK